MLIGRKECYLKSMRGRRARGSRYQGMECFPFFLPNIQQNCYSMIQQLFFFNFWFIFCKSMTQILKKTLSLKQKKILCWYCTVLNFFLETDYYFFTLVYFVSHLYLALSWGGVFKEINHSPPPEYVHSNVRTGTFLPTSSCRRGRGTVTKGEYRITGTVPTYRDGPPGPCLSPRSFRE